jgi:signal transduction histidine kinase
MIEPQSAQLLDSLFPFNVAIGADGRILHTGSSLRKVVGDIAGAGFFDVFECQRPVVRSVAALPAHLAEVTLLAIRASGLQLRGQFLRVGDTFVFAGAPRIVDQSSAWSWPVTIGDYAAHDASADYAMVIEATNTQLTDLERLVGRLKDKEKAERELRREAERANQAKTNFLANVSHEIRTPMTAILGYAELLKDPKLSSSERSDYIDTIRRNGDHLLAIINDILDISKIEADALRLDTQDVHVPEIVREVVRLLQVRAVSQGVALSYGVEGDAAHLAVRSDPVRIRQVLLNLVGNAVKFTTEGSVRVTVLGTRRGARAEIRVAVQDTGCGIAPEQLKGLFEPFTQTDTSFTRRHGGAGLGLAISRRLAGMLGGRIEVESEPGRGSTFTFVFEADISEVPGMTGERPIVIGLPTPPSAGPLVGLRVLLVEDSIDSQRILSALLALAGADVTVVGDGMAALSRVEAGMRPDLVIMDIQMPGIDGIEATRILRERGFRGKILALTAAALSGERDRAAKAGCDGFFVKPISRQDLVDMCRVALPREGVAGA